MDEDDLSCNEVGAVLEAVGDVVDGNGSSKSEGVDWKILL
jgi:hypothetical protein